MGEESNTAVGKGPGEADGLRGEGRHDEAQRCSKFVIEHIHRCMHLLRPGGDWSQSFSRSSESQLYTPTHASVDYTRALTTSSSFLIVEVASRTLELLGSWGGIILEWRNWYRRLGVASRELVFRQPQSGPRMPSETVPRIWVKELAMRRPRQRMPQSVRPIEGPRNTLASGDLASPRVMASLPW